MRILYTLLLILFASSYSQAQQERYSQNYRNNNPILSVTSFYPVQIYVDGRRINSLDKDGLFLNNLRPGYHSLRITQRRGRISNSYRGAETILYETRLLMKRSTHYDFTVNRFGRVFADEQDIDSRYYSEMQHDHEPENYYMIEPMSDSRFSALLATLKNESFETSRLVIAKQAMEHNFFTVVQIKSIMDAFSYEDSKLEIAKAAYPLVVDPDNYFMVNEALQYSSSKMELAKFISEHQQ